MNHSCAVDPSVLRPGCRPPTPDCPQRPTHKQLIVMNTVIAPFAHGFAYNHPLCGIKQLRQVISTMPVTGGAS